jgi:hypothetical protein
MNTIEPSQDAHINSRAAGSNYGTSVTSEIYVALSGHYRYLADFNIAGLGLPVNAIIVSAYFRLTPTGIGEGGAGSGDFVLQAITSSWSEGTVTYTGQPTTTSSNQVTTSAWTGTQREFDVTLLVQNLINGTQTFSGFRIQRNPETGADPQCQYHTLQAATSGLRPKLEIQWYIPYSISAATTTQTTTLTSTDGSISPTITGGSGTPTGYKWINSAGTTVGTSLNLTGVPYGWYGLEVTGPLGDKFYMAFLIGVKCETVKVLFRQDTNFIDDSYVRNFLGTTLTNYGTANFIQAGGASSMYGGQNIFLRYRLWFDPNNYFFKASDKLIGNGTSAVSGTLYAATADWTESLINWNNQPGVNLTTPPPVAVPLLPVPTDPQVLDVTNLFRYWSSNPNYGYRISSPTTGYQAYHSSEIGNSNIPQVTMWIEDNACDKTGHVSFKPVLDGSMVLAYKGKLKLQFTEEYQQEPGKKWPIQLYDYNRQFIAGINYDGTQVPPANPPLLPAIEYVFGDNRATLNLSSYSLTDGGYYIMELTKSTGEKEYVEFIYKN